MKNLTITAMGQPQDRQTKFGVKQVNYIKAKEEGDKFLNYWLNQDNRAWKIGDVVEVADISSREYQGKTYYDLVLPKKDDKMVELKGEIVALSLKLGSMSLKLDSIIDHLRGEKRLDTTSDGGEMPSW